MVVHGRIKNWVTDVKSAMFLFLNWTEQHEFLLHSNRSQVIVLVQTEIRQPASCFWWLFSEVFSHSLFSWVALLSVVSSFYFPPSTRQVQVFPGSHGGQGSVVSQHANHHKSTWTTVTTWVNIFITLIPSGLFGGPPRLTCMCEHKLHTERLQSG